MKGIIINWIGTIASIPSDWLLCDGNNSTPNLLGKYLLSVGDGEEPGTTGGSETHTHTSPEHTHTQDAHSHSGNTNTTADDGRSGILIYYGQYAGSPHYHSFTTSSAIATNQVTSNIVDSTSNNPRHYKVAPIIDVSINGSKYPNNSIVFWGQSTLPYGWSICNGTEDTPDLRNCFLKFINSEENPGDTGGSNTHSHTTTHTHIQDEHNHSGNTNTTSTIVHQPYYPASPTYWTAPAGHIHSLTVNLYSTINQNDNSEISSEDGQPNFKKLLIILNTGISNRPKYSILIWTGSIANIPLGYVLCNGENETPDLRNYFIKGANDSSELLNIGGSSIHNHTASSHTHIQNSHSHTILANNSGDEVVNNQYANNGTPAMRHNHSHTVSDALTTATNQSTTVTIDNCSSQANYPPYYKVAFIMQDREMDIGAYSFTVS